MNAGTGQDVYIDILEKQFKALNVALISWEPETLLSS